jgi:hypothetical protein
MAKVGHVDLNSRGGLPMVASATWQNAPFFFSFSKKKKINNIFLPKNITKIFGQHLKFTINTKIKLRKSIIISPTQQ